MAVVLCLVGLAFSGMAYDASQRENGQEFALSLVVAVLAFAGLYAVAH